jgi:quinol monooxygenase YgiN
VIARTVSVDVGPERIGEVLDAYRDAVRPIHERASGLEAHVVLADRDAGRLLFIGIWRSEGAVADVAAELEPARKRLWDAFGRSPDLVRYEVVDQIRIRDSLS